MGQAGGNWPSSPPVNEVARGGFSPALADLGSPFKRLLGDRFGVWVCSSSKADLGSNLDHWGCTIASSAPQEQFFSVVATLGSEILTQKEKQG